MRRWMKLLTVGGVVCAAISVGMAGERLFERRTIDTTRPKRSSLEFISRGSRADDAAATIETVGDTKSESPSPIKEIKEIEPKRYVRQKNAAAEASAPKSAAAKRLEDELFGDSTNATEPTTKSASKTTSTIKRLQPKATVESTLTPTDQVELLPPPKKLDHSIVDRKPTAKEDRAAPIADSNVIPAGFDEDSAPAPTASTPAAKKPTATNPKSRVVPADFVQKSDDKPHVQVVGANQTADTSPITAETSPAGTAPAKAPRVSVIQDKSARPIAGETSRAPRTFNAHEAVVATRGIAPHSSGSPAVSVEWHKRGEILVGKECACDLIVKNNGKVAARQVVVDAHFPATVRLTHAEPQPIQADDHLEWSFPELAAGDERVIHIAMIPSQRGDLATTANVRFTGTAASVFHVAEPLLKVAINAPKEVIVGDPLVQTVTVSNPGTGVAQNVRLKVAIPEGLEHSRGDRSLIELGSLAPGESRTVRLSFTAIEGGEQTLQVAAIADAGLKHIAEATVDVIAPALSIVLDGPEVRSVGRDARYVLTITNEGAAANNNVRVTHRVPKGFTFVKADKGGSFNATQGTVDWFIGRLEAEQEVQLKLQLLANAQGDFEHHAQASTEHGFVAKAEATTKIEGSAALVLEIQDLEDPVEVGNETVYEIRVSNNGSKAAQNVGLAFEFPSGLELLEVQSATEHLAKNGLILFNDVPALLPGKTALYRIRVCAHSEGNHRVRARLTSESIDQEIICEEITKFTAE